MPHPRLLAHLAAAGSALLLLGALAFQYLGGLAPCPLCLWQRWPHVAALVIWAIWAATGLRGLLLLGALAAAASAGIGVFHAGVELGYWAGLQSCSGNSISGMSAADLLNPAVDIAPVTRCDEIAWSFLGLSMAGWNVLLSATLGGLWLAAFLRRG